MSVKDQTRSVHVIGTGSTKNRVYGDTDFLKVFIPAAAALIPPQPASKTINVKARRRRRYPGDPGVAVRASARKVLDRVPAKGAGALPGRRFSLALITTTGEVDVDSKRQFTYQGSFTNLVSNLDGMSSVKMIVYSPTGHPYRLNTTVQ